jgi:hypothetical protein
MPLRTRADECEQDQAVYEERPTMQVNPKIAVAIPDGLQEPPRSRRPDVPVAGDEILWVSRHRCQVDHVLLPEMENALETILDLQSIGITAPP